MSTGIKLQNICGHTSIIRAEQIENGVHITIHSTCSKVDKWGSDFIISDECMMNTGNSAFIENDKRDILTPTCLVPVLVLNAAWIECGMISKNLARKFNLADIEYIEDVDNWRKPDDCQLRFRGYR